MGILDPDDMVDAFESTQQVDAAYTSHSRAKSARVMSELAQWNKAKLQPTPSPLRYWIELAKSPNNPFPILSRLALDIFSIPAMSAECERVFSETKRLISDDRNQLAASTIEAVSLQKNWLDNNLIKSDLHRKP